MGYLNSPTALEDCAKRFETAAAEFANKPARSARSFFKFEKTAANCPDQHKEIATILFDFIRKNTSLKREQQEKEPRENIQTALNFIETLNIHDGEETSHPDLHQIDLREIDLLDAQLNYANLSETLLQYANLDRVHLQHANLSGAQLQNVKLEYAYLQHANLSGAQLENARLRYTQLEHADFKGAHLNNTFLIDTDLTQTKNLTQEQIDQAFGGAETTLLPDHLHTPDHWFEYPSFDDAYEAWHNMRDRLSP